VFQAVWRSVAPLDPEGVYGAWLAVSAWLMKNSLDDLGVAQISDLLTPTLGERSAYIALEMWIDIQRSENHHPSKAT